MLQKQAAETGSRITSRDQPEKLSDEFIFQKKIISEAEVQSTLANKLSLPENIISEQEVETLLSDTDKNKINS